MTDFVQVTLGGQTFWVLDPEKYPHGVNAFSEEEPIFAEWMRQAAPGRVLVDVGAGWGTYTLPALAAGAEVVGFEPSQEQARALSESVDRNGWNDRCEINVCALFDGGPCPPELASWVHGTAYPATDVVYRALDEYIRLVGGRIDCIKIDVEGGELGVLRGAARTLQQWKPVVLIEDHAGVNPGHVVSDYPESVGGTAALVQFLGQYGYECELLRWEVTNPARKYLIARPK